MFDRCHSVYYPKGPRQNLIVFLMNSKCDLLFSYLAGNVYFPERNDKKK